MVSLNKFCTVSSNAALIALRGIKPIDIEAHYKITLASLSYLRRNGYHGAYAYYKDNLCYLQSGIAKAELRDEGLASVGGKNRAEEIIQKHMNSARVCIAAGQEDMALSHLGASLHILQDTCILSIPIMKLIAVNEIVESCVKKRYHPLRRDRGGRKLPIILNSPSDYLDEAEKALRITKIGYFKTGDVFNTTALNFSLDIAEKLCAGFLISFYDELIINEEEREMKKKNTSKVSKKDSDKGEIADSKLDIGGGKPVSGGPYGSSSSDNDF